MATQVLTSSIMVGHSAGTLVSPGKTGSRCVPRQPPKTSSAGAGAGPFCGGSGE